MAKIRAMIGFSVQVPKEDMPSYFENRIIEKPYQGDATRISRRYQSNEHSTIDGIVLSETFSTVANDFLTKHLDGIVYVTRFGTKWKVTNVTVEFPRVILTLGERYNEEDETIRPVSCGCDW